METAQTIYLKNDDIELLIMAVSHSIAAYNKLGKKANESFYNSRIKRLNSIADRLAAKLKEQGI